MRTEQIASCPFCGSADHLSVQSLGSFTGDMPSRPYRVICTHIDHDDVAGPVGYGRAAAVAAWNTRPAIEAMLSASPLVYSREGEGAYSTDIAAGSPSGDAASAPPCKSEWRPIESAPRDGSVFFAFRPPHHVEAVEYVAPYEKLGVQFGGVFHGARGCSLVVRWDCFTHWLPLPTSPLGEW